LTTGRILLPKETIQHIYGFCDLVDLLRNVMLVDSNSKTCARLLLGLDVPRPLYISYHPDFHSRPFSFYPSIEGISSGRDHHCFMITFAQLIARSRREPRYIGYEPSWGDIETRRSEFLHHERALRERVIEYLGHTMK
jgi:hypothetical protein